jgi:DNA polymerase-1
VVSLFPEDDPTRINLDLQSWVELWEWLADKQIVMMNAPFDCRFMFRGVDRPEAGWSVKRDLMPQVIWDVGVAARELWPTEGIALKPTCVREEILHPRHWIDMPLPCRTAQGWYKGIEAVDKDAVKSWLKQRKLPVSRYDLVEWPVMEPYAALDAELTLREYLRQKEILSDPFYVDLEKWIDREHRKMHALHPTEMRGIPFDVKGCQAAANKIAVARLRLAVELPFGNNWGAEVNLNAAKQFFFGPNATNRALELMEETPTGAVKLDKEITRRLVRDRIPWAKEWMNYKELGDALSKWYHAFPEKAGSDGRLRPVFNISTVKSGRTSTSRINMQGVPGDYRVIERLPEGVRTPKQLVKASPGHDLWALDVAQAELRIGARWARCPTMEVLINAGEDLHAYSAKNLFGVDEAHKDWSLLRHVAKQGNFALIYDCGAQTFQTMLSKQVGIEWEFSRVQRLVNDWKALYPEFREAVMRAKRVVERRGYIKLKNGRQSWFKPEDLLNPHKAFNRFVQGSLAEMAADWLIYTEEHHPGLMVNFVHDAIYLEVPHERTSEVEIIKAKGIEIFENMFDIVGGIDAHIESRG